MMILQSLRHLPMHGYALVQHIGQRSNDLLQAEEGSLNPTLQRTAARKAGARGVDDLSHELQSAELRDSGGGAGASGARDVELRADAARINFVLAPQENKEPTVISLGQISRCRQIHDDLTEEIEQNLAEETDALMARA